MAGEGNDATSSRMMQMCLCFYAFRYRCRPTRAEDGGSSPIVEHDIGCARLLLLRTSVIKKDEKPWAQAMPVINSHVVHNIDQAISCLRSVQCTRYHSEVLSHAFHPTNHRPNEAIGADDDEYPRLTGLHPICRICMSSTVFESEIKTDPSAITDDSFDRTMTADLHIVGRSPE